MNKIQAHICLIIVTVCMSTEVIILKAMPGGISDEAILCITSLIASALLCFIAQGRLPEAVRHDGVVILRHVVILSVLYYVYQNIQIHALEHFEVSQGIFANSLTMVVLPFVLLIRRREVNIRTWMAAIVAAFGIGAVFVSAFVPSMLPGIGLMFISSTIEVFYITKVNDFAREHDPLALAALLAISNTVIGFITWFVTDPTTFASVPWSSELVAALFIHGYFIGTFALILNVFAQRQASPQSVTIIFATQILFTVVFGVALPAEVVDPVMISVPLVFGCLCIVLGNLVEIIDLREIAQKIRGERPEELPEMTVEDVVLDEDTGVPPVTYEYPRLSVLPSNKPLRTIVLMTAYLAVSLPFKALVIIPGFTGFRPVEMLVPFFGVFFGLPGCFACAVGNLITDALSDSLRISSIMGFVANFVGPLIFYIALVKRNDKPFALRTPEDHGRMALVAIIAAAVEALLITPTVMFFYPEVDGLVFALSVLVNDTLAPLLLGVPLMIIVQEEFGYVPKLWHLDEEAEAAE